MTLSPATGARPTSVGSVRRRARAHTRMIHLMRWLLPFARVAGAVLVSGVVFGLIHGQFYQHPGAQGALLTVELSMIGVMLGVLVVRTGSLRTSFATHAAFNLTATILSVAWS